MSGVLHLLGDLFGAGTWGTGGNIVAAGILAVPAYLGRAPLGRWIAGHIHHHLAARVEEHAAAAAGAAVAAHLERIQTPAPGAPVAAGGVPTATPPAGTGPAAAASPPAPAAAAGLPPLAVHHEPEPAPPHQKGSA